MESRKGLVWGVVLALMLAAVGLVAWSLMQQGGDPPVSDLLRQADEVVVFAPVRDMSVKPGRDFYVDVSEIYRGDLKTGTSVRVVAPGDADFRFSRGGRYVLLLRKSEKMGGYELLGRQTLTLNDQTVREVLGSESRSEWVLSEFRGLVDQNQPPSRAERRDKIAGRWLLISTQASMQSAVDHTAALLDLGDSEGGRLLASNISAGVLRSAKVDGDKVQLTIAGATSDVSFEGVLDGGIVRGELRYGDQAVLPARLEATTLESLKGREESPPTDGAAAFFRALDEQTEAALRTWIRSYPGNPLAMQAWQAILVLQLSQKADRKGVESTAESFAAEAGRWGPRLKLGAHLQVGMLLSKSELPSELALKHLEIVAEGKSIPLWKSLARRVEGELFLRRGQAEKGVATLKQTLVEFPLDVETMLILAKHYESAREPDKAMEIYADLTVLPGLHEAVMEVLGSTGQEVSKPNLPFAKLSKLWTEKHGNTTGLAAYQDERYEKRMPPFRPERVPPRKPGTGNRISLLENFTGTGCLPCIGPDTAIDALTLAYAPTDLILLEYHVTTAGFDPFANEQTEARFKEVKAAGSPFVLLNGKPVIQSGGPILLAERMYHALRYQVDAAMKEQTSVRISLTARSTGDNIHVTVEAGGKEPFPDAYRLRLVVAENPVNFKGPNGMRSHHMVVRTMPLGPGGIPPTDGRFEVRQSVNLRTIRDEIQHGLEHLDAQLKTTLPKPLDFKSFVVVAFVSNGAGDVLQAAASAPLPGLKK